MLMGGGGHTNPLKCHKTLDVPSICKEFLIKGPEPSVSLKDKMAVLLC